MEGVLVFPHQLFENHPSLALSRSIFLIEEEHFFSRFRFHKQKLVFHRASLKNFASFLKRKGYKVHYIEQDLESHLKKMGVSKLYVVQLDDLALEKKVTTLAKKLKTEIKIEKSPSFITTIENGYDFFKRKKKFRFESFYIQQRKKLHILLNEAGKPIGGKWNFDQANRKRLPKDKKLPVSFKTRKTPVVKEAISYIEKKYKDHLGTTKFFNYPTTHSSAKKSLDNFLQHRLSSFGDYEDAIIREETILFHSCLSPLLNVGLLTPEQVIKKTIEYTKKHLISINNLEGFIRQVIGWREFIRGAYHAIGNKEKNMNFFNHNRKMPLCFYTGTTGILPVDETIKKLNKGAYLHHIERLMILGNFFLLCEIAPNDVYTWFMEFFIDAYDWVMIPNVYGMSQYADGGMITTKPYFSSSHYILKMSNYPKGNWCKIWDSLFWRFIIKHIIFFEKQPRLSFLCKIAIKKKKEPGLFDLAEHFLRELK